TRLVCWAERLHCACVQSGVHWRLPQVKTRLLFWATTRTSERANERTSERAAAIEPLEAWTIWGSESQSVPMHVRSTCSQHSAPWKPEARAIVCAAHRRLSLVRIEKEDVHVW